MSAVTRAPRASFLALCCGSTEIPMRGRPSTVGTSPWISPRNGLTLKQEQFSIASPPRSTQRQSSAFCAEAGAAEIAAASTAIPSTCSMALRRAFFMNRPSVV